MKRVLATAYDVNPYRGSESGTGWNFAVQLARFNRVTVITRKNNRDEIERYLKANGTIDNLFFEYFDFIQPILWIKKLLKFHFIYFNFWQLGVVFKFFSKRRDFDVFHCINFHADHVPHFLWILGRSVVWGPVNHSEILPRVLANKFKYHLLALLNFGMKHFRWNFDPLVRLSVKKSTYIIGSTAVVQKRLSIPNEKFVLLPTIGSKSTTQSIQFNQPEILKFLIVGRLVPIKCLHIALHAFRIALSTMDRSASLVIIGDGPLKKELIELAIELGIITNIEFKGELSHDEVFEEYISATALLFPSFEGGGAVVGEALSFGLPVILNKGVGAADLFPLSYPFLIGKGSSLKDYIESNANAINDIARLSNKEYMTISSQMKCIYKTKVNWDSKGEVLRKIYSEL
jgi:glycosyltransferase involved in cell wall biosynthesis